MFPLITTSDSGSGAGKQAQAITLPPPCLTVSMMIVFIKCCVSVMLNVTGTNLTKSSTFVILENIFIIKIFFAAVFLVAAHQTCSVVATAAGVATHQNYFGSATGRVAAPLNCFVSVSNLCI